MFCSEKRKKFCKTNVSLEQRVVIQYLFTKFNSKVNTRKKFKTNTQTVRTGGLDCTERKVESQKQIGVSSHTH